MCDGMREMTTDEMIKTGRPQVEIDDKIVREIAWEIETRLIGIMRYANEGRCIPKDAEELDTLEEKFAEAVKIVRSYIVKQTKEM